MVKILYNNCYGGFDFSEEFKAEYARRKGEPIESRGRLYRLGSDSIRCDPVTVAIFEEFGSERSSGPHSAIELCEIPATFAHYWEVEESDGDETVRVVISEAYADILHTYMASGDTAALVRQYRALKVAEDRWRRREPAGPGAEVGVLKPEADAQADSDNGNSGTGSTRIGHA